MQVNISKVKITDTRSALHDQFADLTIEDGSITGIRAVKKTKKDAFSVTIDGQEVLSIPGEVCVSCGWVDVFADYREPGYEHKETLATGMAAAAAGGFTDVLLVPNTQPVVNNKSGIQFILQRAAGKITDLHPMGAATQNAEGKDLAEMMDMEASGACAFTDGWKPIQSANLALKAMEYVKAFGGTLVQMPIDASLASGGLMNEGIVSTQLGMPGIPALAETLMLYRDIELLRYTSSKLHVTGISTAGSVAMIRKAKADGLAISCSVTPYHLALTEDMLTTYNSAYKVSPPLRGEEDRMALIEALTDGTIDCIATHHRPQEWDAKTREFEYAADGMAIQEEAFPIMWDTLKTYINTGRLTELLSTRPAQIFNLEEKLLEPGSKASLTFFSTTATTTITKTTKSSMSVNNPYLDKPLAGKVVGIFNNNQLHINK